MLGEALAPLHCCWIAEPKLLLQFVYIVHAKAADVGCLLLAFAAEAPFLSMMSPLVALEMVCLLYHRRCCSGDSSGHLVQDSSLCCAHTLLVLDEIVRKPSNKFEALCCTVVRMNHLLEK